MQVEMLFETLIIMNCKILLTLYLKIVRGFCMVIARSTTKITNMSVSQEIREYFSKLVKPLATYETSEDIFEKLKEEIISKFEEKFDEQN